MISGVVELQVGNRPGRAADRLPVHPADEAEQSPGRREITEDVVALVVQGAADLNQARIVGAAVQAQLSQPGGLQFSPGGGAAGSMLTEPLDGRVLFQFHDAPP